MSSSKRWASAELPGRSPLHAAAAAGLSPVRQSHRRSSSRSDPADSAAGAGSVAGRTLWPSSSSGKSGRSKNDGRDSPRAPSPLTSTLADHLARDDTTTPPVAAASLSRQRSCTELPRSADAAEARKIGKSSAFGRSMRFLPSSKPAGVTLTPGRVAPSDLRRSRDADAASSSSECSDASAPTPRNKPRSPLLPRTSSVRLLGSSATQWALSPGRRSGSPTAVPEPAANKCSKKGGLIGLGWGHLFNRRKNATDDAALAAAAATLLASSPVSSSRSSGRSGGEVGHQMKMAHCRLLQWRFANARAEAVRRHKHKVHAAEVELMGAWASVAEMRGKVARKRVLLDKDKARMELNAVLASQMKYLESWEHVESKHASALDSTVACARVAVCRLPLTNGAKVSMPSLASNLQYALDLVATTKTTTRPFAPMAQETKSVVSELVRVAREEQDMLHECLELLSQFSSLQVEEQSLRCHLVQSLSSSLTSITVQ